MTPQEFKARWQEVASKDNINHAFRNVEWDHLVDLKVSEATKDWLFHGIPEKAAFYRLDLFPPLRRVYEIFAPTEWTNAQKETVQPYFVLGEDGGGNAICIHESREEIWLLDHETFFQEREFINSSLEQFLEFSLLNLRASVGDIDYAELLEPMKQIDPVAMSPEHTWLQVVHEEIEEEKR